MAGEIKIFSELSEVLKYRKQLKDSGSNTGGFQFWVEEDGMHAGPTSATMTPEEIRDMVASAIQSLNTRMQMQDVS